MLPKAVRRKAGACNAPSGVRRKWYRSCHVFLNGVLGDTSATKNKSLAERSLPSSIHRRIGRRYTLKHSEKMRARNSYSSAFPLSCAMQASSNTSSRYRNGVDWGSASIVDTILARACNGCSQGISLALMPTRLSTKPAEGATRRCCSSDMCWSSSRSRSEMQS